MPDLLDLAARAIDGEDVRTNRTTCELSEIAPGIALVEAFSHVVVFRTTDGLLVFDTSAEQFAPRVLESLAAWSTDPVQTIVYTHGHIDHVGGAPAFVARAKERGHPRPRVVAHENVARRFARYDLTNGYNAVINGRQFGPTRIGSFTQPTFFADWVQPDTSYEARMTLRVGELEVALQHDKGETDDHTWAWLPAHRAVVTGDFLTWVFPNAGNPQKVQRYPLEWARALRKMAALEPELLLPAHGLPIAGRERIAGVLDDVASALEFLVRETLAAMNRGARLDDIVREVRLPDETLRKPYLRPVYDEPEFVVRNVWRGYGGWYDGNPAHLKPAPDAAIGVEVARLAGSPAALAERAREVAKSGDLALACHLAEWAWLAAPEDASVRAIRTEVYEARRDAELSLMARGIFGAAARE